MYKYYCHKCEHIHDQFPIEGCEQCGADPSHIISISDDEPHVVVDERIISWWRSLTLQIRIMLIYEFFNHRSPFARPLKYSEIYDIYLRFHN